LFAIRLNSFGNPARNQRFCPVILNFRDLFCRKTEISTCQTGQKSDFHPLSLQSEIRAPK
jgi:hypothetical protein